MAEYREDKKPIRNEYVYSKNTLNYSCQNCNHCSCKNPFVRSEFDRMQKQWYIDNVLNSGTPDIPENTSIESFKHIKKQKPKKKVVKENFVTTYLKKLREKI